MIRQDFASIAGCRQPLAAYWAQKRRVAPTEVATVKTFLITKTLSFLV
jgi:hypothetical protein